MRTNKFTDDDEWCWVGRFIETTSDDVNVPDIGIAWMSQDDQGGECRRTHKEACHNARLMAAAPWMFDMLATLTNDMDSSYLIPEEFDAFYEEMTEELKTFAANKVVEQTMTIDVEADSEEEAIEIASKVRFVSADDKIVKIENVREVEA